MEEANTCTSTRSSPSAILASNTTPVKRAFSTRTAYFYVFRLSACTKRLKREILRVWHEGKDLFTHPSYQMHESEGKTTRGKATIDPVAPSHFLEAGFKGYIQTVSKDKGPNLPSTKAEDLVSRKDEIVLALQLPDQQNIGCEANIQFLQTFRAYLVSLQADRKLDLHNSNPITAIDVVSDTFEERETTNDFKILPTDKSTVSERSSGAASFEFERHEAATSDRFKPRSLSMPSKRTNDAVSNKNRQTGSAASAPTVLHGRTSEVGTSLSGKVPTGDALRLVKLTVEVPGKEKFSLLPSVWIDKSIGELTQFFTTTYGRSLELSFSKERCKFRTDNLVQQAVSEILTFDLDLTLNVEFTGASHNIPNAQNLTEAVLTGALDILGRHASPLAKAIVKLKLNTWVLLANLLDEDMTDIEKEIGYSFPTREAILSYIRQVALNRLGAIWS